MNNYELRKEARESWHNDNDCSNGLSTDEIYVCGYLAAAVPRENRIKELEDALEHTRKLYGDELEKAYKENARMRELLKTLNESVVMTADDVFWNLKDAVEKFLEE